MRSLAYKSNDFTKRPGPVPFRDSGGPRLSWPDHAAFRRLIRGCDDSKAAADARMKAWATLLAGLEPPESLRVRSTYSWIINKTRPTATPMRYKDARTIVLAGLRAKSPQLDTPAEWQAALKATVPDVLRYVYDAHKYRPAQAVFIPPAICDNIVGTVAEIAVPRDRDGRRREVGEELARVLQAKCAEWNVAGAYTWFGIMEAMLSAAYHNGELDALAHASPNAKVRTLSDVRFHTLCEGFRRKLLAVTSDQDPEAIERFTNPALFDRE